MTERHFKVRSHRRHHSHKSSIKRTLAFAIPCVTLLIAVIIGLKYKESELDRAERDFFDQHYEAAMTSFVKLAAKGDPVAENFLGMMYLMGNGVEQDYGKAVMWFAKAAGNKNSRALHNLALCYLAGKGVPVDVKMALKLEIAAARYRPNFMKVQHQKGGDFFIIAKGNENEKKAGQGLTHDGRITATPYDIKALRESFDSGTEKEQAEAAYLLGLAYYDEGKGNRRDMKLAENWFRKSADRGNCSAQTSIGMMYFLGNGVLQDYRKAAYWFGLASRNGSKDGQFMLGYLYSSGLGVHVDYSQAAILFSLAVLNNHSLAKCYLAELYCKGLGVYQNKDLARILTQEGNKETDSNVCVDVWELNSLSKLDGYFP